MPSLSPPPPSSQRRDGVGGKRGKGKRGGLQAAAVAVPLASAALFIGLLFYISRHFGGVIGSYDDRSLMKIHSAGVEAAGREEVLRRRDASVGAAVAADDGGGMLLLSALSAADGGSGLDGLSSDGGVGGSTHKRSGWLSAALLWAEEHHRHRQKAAAGPYQNPSGCGQLPCATQRARRPRTLVIYAYSAVDAEQQDNFEYFLRYGIEEQEWLRYRIILASGGAVLPPKSQPELPRNARYVPTPNCTSGVWGILAAAAPALEAELAAAAQLVVVSSEARGPFMPPYTRQFMHWTDAFTSKLNARTKLVAAALTCEGAPKGGDAAGEWRQNPFALPYAWATDKEGWAVMAAAPGVLRCYESPWDVRYHSDSGAALALLSGGFNLDTLLSKYQGVDWWNQRTWGCNQRVRPDAEWSYDGVSISPYETVFVPVGQGTLQGEWSFARQAAKYAAWADSEAAGNPQGNSNAFVGELWSLRGQRMVAANSRGPGCFDFAYYLQHNPDLAAAAGQEAALWEHFVLLGQFQGRSHRFTCPLQLGNSYKAAYARARGRRCFDHNFYATHNLDVRLAGLGEASQLFAHYADFGQFEQRAAKWVCSDLMPPLSAGFDSRQLAPLPRDPLEQNAEKWEGLAAAAAAEAAAQLGKLEERGSVDGGAAAALEAAAAEAGAKAAAVAAKGRLGVEAAAAQAAAAIEAERRAAIEAARREAAAREAQAAAAQQQQQQQQQAQEQEQAAAAAEGAGAQQAAAERAAADATAGAAQQQGAGLQQAAAAEAVLAAGAAGAALETVGDAANAAAFSEIQAADAEAAAAAAEVQAAAGGGEQGVA